MAAARRLLRGAAALLRRAQMRRLQVRLAVDDSAQIDLAAVRAVEQTELTVGAQSILQAQVAFERPRARLFIGNRTFVNGNVIVAEQVRVGDDVLIAWGVTIVDHDSHPVAFSLRRGDVERWGRGEKQWDHVAVAPVTVCDKAWIGFNAIILKGVTIGEGAVVGAGAVVTKDVAPWTIVAGNPARLVREIPLAER